jgi:pimeloyl-ACP methyl ester carboxylesterase
MKYDCPNCQHPLKGIKLVRRADAYGVHAFDCPKCGERLDDYKHPTEIGVTFVVLGLGVGMGTAVMFYPAWARAAVVAGLVLVAVTIGTFWRIAQHSPRYRVVRREV